MTPRSKKEILKRLRTTSLSKWYDLKLFLALKWIDIRYDVEEWFCLKTWKWRAKHTKWIRLYSLGYNQPQMCWDDVEVTDQWGLWLPIGFGIVSKANWDVDQQINRDIGEPEEEWKDFVDGDWPTYYYKDEFLTHNHYIDAARKHMKYKLGENAYNKDFELRLKMVSQKWIDEETIRWAEWAAGGSKPFKVELTEGAKESFKDLFGESSTQQIVDEIEKRNKEIGDQAS